jgi:hypothetical protein
MSYDCFLCQQPFRFGSGRYDGRPVRAWDIMLCNRCEGSNWDGIVLEGHPRLEAHLKAKGVPVKLNAKGWLGIPPRGS